MKKYFIFFLLCISNAIYSQEMGPGSGEHPRPPKEALDACKGKSAGASCEFLGREQTKLSGTCFQPNTSLPLACRPANMPAKSAPDSR